MKRVKKLLAAVLCFTFVAASGVAAFANITAAPTQSTVIVDGRTVAFEAYNIGGSNFFKLRDLAHTLNNSARQFDLSFDGEQNTIVITSGRQYTAVGGEMTRSGGSRTAAPTSARVRIDGSIAGLSAYNIGGSNYFMLRDVARRLDFSAELNTATNTITIDTSRGFSDGAVVNYDAIRGTKLMIATTTSTNDAGLLDVLVPAFDAKYGTTTEWVSVGSGAAMTMGREGNADVLLVHSRAAENTFMNDGFGESRKDVMYNAFLLVGPNNDPAGASSANSAKDAFEAIARSGSDFLSRADKSGTHARELEIWAATNVSPSGAADRWYNEAGVGMMDLLLMTNEFNGYTLTDSATWARALNQNNAGNLKVVFDTDDILFNPYGVIVVSPEKYPNLNTLAARAFADYITSAEGQRVIGDYRMFGEQLFVPSAR